VDAENLPVWLGGRSKGTLLDDVGPWSDPEVLHRLESDLPAAGRALRALRVSMGSGVGGMVDEEEDGYASPRWVVEVGLMLCLVGDGARALPWQALRCSDNPFFIAHSSPKPQNPPSTTPHTRSEASFASALSTCSSLPESLGSPTLLRTSLGDKKPPSLHPHLSLQHSLQQQQQRVGMAAERTSSDQEGLIAAVNAARTQSLVERTQALEQLYAQQMQRLKGYMPAGAYARVAQARLAAPDGSLLQRVDVLEEALELLLRAQDLAWQEEERRRARDSCCGRGCVIS